MITSPASTTRSSSRRPRSFGRMLADAAARWPTNEALVIADRRQSYAELLDAATGVAVALESLGVGPRDRVGLLLPNSVAFVDLLFGASLVGATIVPFNTRFKPDELAYVISDSDPVCTITTDAIDDHVDLASLLASARVLRRERYTPASRPELDVLLGSTVRADMIADTEFFTPAGKADLAAARERLLSVETDTPSAIVYTSGTTSRPRGALLEKDAFEHWSRAGALWELTESDRFWDPCPLFHIAGLGPLVWTIDHGATFLSDTYFDATAGLRQIAGERATLLYPTYPPIMRALMSHDDFATTDLSSVRAFLNVAPPEDLRAMQSAIPHAAEISLYGSTEGGPVTMHAVGDSEQFRLGTNGRPLPGVELRLFDSAAGTAVGVDEPGEIQYRGPNAFSGYLNDPGKTAESIDAEGWVHTGDLGRRDSDGTLYYLGRVNDMIKVGGENVAPAEVEGVLGEHPAVKLCQVVGIPDERLVEVVAAFVELLPGAGADEEELLAYCRERMARYKVPVVLRFVESWPMSATKIQRAKLRDILLAEREQ